jgi:hypothetical protein
MSQSAMSMWFSMSSGVALLYRRLLTEIFRSGKSFDFFAPFIISVHIWKGDHITAKEDFQSLVELALSSGG